MKIDRTVALLTIGGGTVMLTAIYVMGPMLYGLLAGGLQTFVMPSESMSPTLMVGDRFVAHAIVSADLKRGDIVVFNTQFGGRQVKYVKRVAALPGDIIELRNGVIWLNSAVIKQTQISTNEVDISGEKIMQTRLNERFPGENQTHEIFDNGKSVGDNFAPVKIPKSYVFMLGDNRDNSADSRFDNQFGGVGMVDTSEVFARVTKIYWSKDSRRIGKAIN